jgi:RNAse (barnase) inhibitor barstar
MSDDRGTSRVIEIAGDRIRDIPTLYVELDRALMRGLDWRLGESLDALNDVLYGGFGTIEGDEAVTLVWRDFAASAAALGVETTREWLRRRLGDERYAQDRLVADLAALDAGTGMTYLDRVVEVIESHPNIALDRR